MSKLILIKHAAPVVSPGVPPEKWVLSDEGKRRCAPLAEAIRPYAPAAVVSSLEPKAAETGELVAAQLAVAFEAAAGLHEHDRSNVPHMQSREFISLVELFFRKPSERVLGNESADEALARFEQAVADVPSRYAGQTVAIVSHGTVLSLLLAKHGGGRAFELWRRMGLPSYAVIDLPAWRVERIVEKV
jgi:2,3-bisphosphoglycerate-dependent phosphoglycerate mutase